MIHLSDSEVDREYGYIKLIVPKDDMERYTIIRRRVELLVKELNSSVRVY